MKFREHKIIIISSLIFILSAFNPAFSIIKEKKLVVNRDGVTVHLEPDSGSDVIAELTAGTELLLASDRKFKKVWHYVYFPSEKSSAMRSGYIHQQDITRLYSNTKVVTLDEKGRRRYTQTVHFRKTHWGMSRTQVMASEGRGGRFEEKNGFTVLEYQDQLLSQDCELNYIFTQDHLTGAKYRFSAIPEKSSRLKTSYDQIFNVFSGQYGPPEKGEAGTESLRHISLFPNGHGAMEADELLHRAFWATPETEIMLLLYKSGREWILDVEYLGVEYKQLVQPKKVQASN